MLFFGLQSKNKSDFRLDKQSDFKIKFVYKLSTVNHFFEHRPEN